MPAHVRATARQRAVALAPEFAWLATQAILNGDFQEAKSALVSAVRLRPWNLAYGMATLAVATAPWQARAIIRALREMRRWLRAHRLRPTGRGVEG